MKLKLYYIFLILFLAITKSTFSQSETINFDPDTLEVFESPNDSIDIVNSTNYFVDSLGYYLFSENSDTLEMDGPFVLTDDDIPANGIYSDWDSLKVHHPRFDFSAKKDTTYLPLLDLNAKYIQPVPGSVTSRFGWRKRRYHYGTDLQLKTGDSVYTCFDGVVRLTKRSRSYGFVVVVRHYNGLETLYAHLSKIKVQPNQKVTAGDCIGLGGNTGRSFGSHLHFETRYLGAAINPEYVFDYTNKKLISDTLLISKSTFNYLYKISKQKRRLKSIKTYTVRKGESLAHIAKRNGTTVNRLKKLNRMKGNTIKPNQRIRIR